MLTVGREDCLVTVLMPVYNSLNIYESIDSVLNQEYHPIQLILIDDGTLGFSVQAIRSYIDEHADRNIQSWIVLRNEQNLGTIKTLNKGLSIAQGEIIFNLAGDDLFCDERVLRDWVKAFQETNAKVMTGIRQNYDHELQKCLGTAPTARQIERLKVLAPDALFEELVLDHFISGASTAHTRQFFQEYGVYDEKYKLIEDFPMNLRVLRQGGRIAFFDRAVIKYRGGGMSSTGVVCLDYERDMRLIFQNEILPYTRYPRRAEQWLRKWGKDIEFDRKYVHLEQKYGRSKCVKYFLRAWYYAHHPIQAIRKLEL